MLESFNINKTKYYIKTIYSSISINNIESYLKKIEFVKKKIKGLEIIIIPNFYIFNIKHIYWAIFIAKNRFSEKINNSNKIWNEILLVFNCTNQINKINKNWYLKKGKQNVFIELVSNKKINKKELSIIKKQLDIKEIKTIKFNKKKSKEFYKIKDNKEVLEQIIERMDNSN